ncbi:MAG: transposase [Crocinitomicaceae bacterium]
MNQYNPNNDRRRSIRLRGYDYSKKGLYFVTICLQNRQCLFGHIQNEKMILNNPGRMVEKWYFELENKFPDIKCDTMVIMPNHFHCIIHNVGADLRVCPDYKKDYKKGQSQKIASTLGEHSILGEHVGSPLHRVIQWFKTMTTNEYIRGVKTLGWQPFDGKLWQRNYWEHIIRNDTSYLNITEYIITNPKKWDADKLNPD